MTKQEYILFLEINYNLKIIEDETHIHTKHDVSESKEKNNSIIALNWLNNNDEVLSALHFISDNWELKKSMDIIGIPPDDDIYNLVSANLKPASFIKR